jgi:hypothetical protein
MKHRHPRIRMRKAALVSLLAAVFAMCSTSPRARADDTRTAPTQVYLIDDELAYAGELDDQANARLFKLYDGLKRKPRTLSILSRGGPVRAGMALGSWVRAHKLNVKVLEYCLSSCANYVFPAGARKIVSNFAVIGFHGGAASMLASFKPEWKTLTPEARTMLVELQASLRAQMQEERSYLKKIGVRGDMVSLGQQEQYQRIYQIDPKTVGWTYSQEDFGRMGVRGIEVINPPWQPGSALKEVRFHLLKLDN